jgi:hypothetical protein
VAGQEKGCTDSGQKQFNQYWATLNLDMGIRVIFERGKDIADVEKRARLQEAMTASRRRVTSLQV